ncbi:MAG: hypothetical protein NTW96_20830 [Planctomycetia bacterium]|nr:hypothetical protein [Planctomycetia bacterium]
MSVASEVSAEDPCPKVAEALRYLENQALPQLAADYLGETDPLTTFWRDRPSHATGQRRYLAASQSPQSATCTLATRGLIRRWPVGCPF